MSYEAEVTMHKHLNSQKSSTFTVGKRFDNLKHLRAFQSVAGKEFAQLQKRKAQIAKTFLPQ